MKRLAYIRSVSGEFLFSELYSIYFVPIQGKNHSSKVKSARHGEVYRLYSAAEWYCSVLSSGPSPGKSDSNLLSYINALKVASIFPVFPSLHESNNCQRIHFAYQEFRGTYSNNCCSLSCDIEICSFYFISCGYVLKRNQSQLYFFRVQLIAETSPFKIRQTVLEATGQKSFGTSEKLLLL